MMAKWLTAAVLFGGLAAAVPASEKPFQPIAPASASVRFEIRGRLHVTVLEDEGIADGRRPILRRYYEIEADGQKFVLDVGAFRGQANDLDGQLVIVTGTPVQGPADESLIRVTGITVPKDDALIKYVRVTVEGQLERLEIPTCDPKGGAIVLWQVRTGGRDFTLVFEDAKVAAQAEKLVGLPVVLTGNFKNGRISVTSVGPDVIERPLLPRPLPFPPIETLPKDAGR
jgi:hypothetical protein